MLLAWDLSFLEALVEDSDTSDFLLGVRARLDDRAIIVKK